MTWPLRDTSNGIVYHYHYHPLHNPHITTERDFFMTATTTNYQPSHWAVTIKLDHEAPLSALYFYAYSMSSVISRLEDMGITLDNVTEIRRIKEPSDA